MEYLIIKQDQLVKCLTPLSMQKLLNKLMMDSKKEMEEKKDNILLGAMLLEHIYTKKEGEKAVWIEFYTIKEGKELNIGISNFVLFKKGEMPDYVLERIKYWKDKSNKEKWENILNEASN